MLDIQSLVVPEVQSHCSRDRLCLTQTISGFPLVNNLNTGLRLANCNNCLVWYKQHKLNVLDIQETETTTRVWRQQFNWKYLVGLSSSDFTWNKHCHCKVLSDIFSTQMFDRVLDYVFRYKSDPMIMSRRDSSADSCLQSVPNIWSEQRINQNSISISKGSLTYWSHFRSFEIRTRGLWQSRNLQSLDPGLRAYCDHKSDSKDVLIIAPIEKTRPRNKYVHWKCDVKIKSLLNMKIFVVKKH